jgi:hypothetical protein
MVELLEDVAIEQRQGNVLDQGGDRDRSFQRFDQPRHKQRGGRLVLHGHTPTCPAIWA